MYNPRVYNPPVYNPHVYNHPDFIPHRNIKPTQKNYNYESITKKSNNNNIKHEMGGTWCRNKNGKLTFRNQFQCGTFQGQEAISGFNFQKYKKVWHSHPKQTIWSPSSADIKLSRYNVPNFIITRHGIWMYYKTIPGDIHQNVLKYTNDVAKSIHQEIALEIRTNKNTYNKAFDKALEMINRYTNYSKAYGIVIKFYPKQKYNQLVKELDNFEKAKKIENDKHKRSKSIMNSILSRPKPKNPLLKLAPKKQITKRK